MPTDCLGVGMEIVVGNKSIGGIVLEIHRAGVIIKFVIDDRCIITVIKFDGIHVVIAAAIDIVEIAILHGEIIGILRSYQIKIFR